MPAVSSEATQTFTPSSESRTQSKPSRSRPNRVSPPSWRVEDDGNRLQECLDELQGLLSGASIPAQPPHRRENARLSTLQATTEKRAYDQIVDFDELINREISVSRPKRDDNYSLIANAQKFAPSSFYIQPGQTTAGEAVLAKNNYVVRLPSMSLEDCISGKCFLPPPDEASSLLKEYLHDYNSRIPLFNPETICMHMRDCYSGAADGSPKSWVLAYITLGFGHRLRAMSLFAAVDDNSKADWYLNKCLSVLPDLLLEEPTLELVQALLGVSVLMQSSDRSRKAALFVSTAMRMAQNLAYNESGEDDEQNSSKEKQELYVFWIAFFMDTAMNLRATRPNTTKLVDISAPLPHLGSLDPSTRDGNGLNREVNMFALHTSLAFIQAEALEELFSVKARRRSAPSIANALKSVISKLGNWNKNNPLAGVDASSILKSMYLSDVMHAIVLEATYFETLYQLHAANALGAFASRLNVFSPDGLRMAGRKTLFELYADAHRFLEFAGLISEKNVPIIWYYLTPSTEL
jgi:hypothetical protein